MAKCDSVIIKKMITKNDDGDGEYNKKAINVKLFYCDAICDGGDDVFICIVTLFYVFRLKN